MKRSILALVVSALSFAGVSGQAADEVVPIQTISVAPSLAMLIGRGGNLAVLTGKDGPVIVDDQYAPQAPVILAAVKALQDAPIRFVINTHFHDDHTGGNEALGNAGAVIVAQDNVRVRLSMVQFSKLLNRSTPALPEIAWPVE
jgi:glyoxylase-like metal-dependent hydrolase (beta-lactamase superfamily II)